ncbi:unnamed protein product [Lathyrus oleraceus]
MYEIFQTHVTLMMFLFPRRDARRGRYMTLFIFLVWKTNAFLLLSWIISSLVAENFTSIFQGFQEGIRKHVLYDQDERVRDRVNGLKKVKEQGWRRSKVGGR